MRWWLLGLLLLLNVLNFVDRQLVPSLAPLLITELGLSRAQVGLLYGAAFVVVYTVAGLALGAAADRWRRLPVIAIGVALWSAATAASGLATRFTHLAAARVFVGIGEAALTPAAMSLLADVFPPHRRALAAGIYSAGIPIGAGASFFVSAWLAPQHGWRSPFLALGAAGIVMAILVAMLREPEARAIPAAEASLTSFKGGAPRPPGPALRELLRTSPPLVATIVGTTALAFSTASMIHVLTWLVEERGFAYREAALWTGGIYAGAGLAGNVAGGWIGDLAHRRWHGGRLLSLAGWALLVSPFGIIFLTASVDSGVFYASWILVSFVSTAWYGTAFATVQEIAPAGLRSTTVAFLMLCFNVFGIALGPWVTGAIGDAAGLTAGLIAASLVSLLGVPVFLYGARRAFPLPFGGS
jgi:MFS family permease